MTTPAPSPISVSVAADKAQYTVGEAISVSVTYTDSATGQPVVVPMVITADVSDSAGNTQSASVTVDVATGATSPAPTMSVKVTDSFGAVYNEAGNSSGQATFTSTVIAPPAAAPAA